MTTSSRSYRLRPVALCLAATLLTAAVSSRAEEKESPFPQIDEFGEWYQVGWHLGKEASPTLAVFGLDQPAQQMKLLPVLQELGVETATLKSRELELLRQGWADGLQGKQEVLLRPPDQARSLVPKALQGFHTFNSPVSALADAVSEWKKGVVIVRNEGVGHGTGFFIAPGLLLTNHHVIAGGTNFTIEQYDGKRDSASIIASRSAPDIALLKTSALAGEVHFKLGDSDAVKDLQEVVLIGYPLTDEVSATVVKGAISSAAKDRVLYGMEMFQVDIRSYGGSSGGPLLTMDGRVVGVHTASLSSNDPALQQFRFAQRMNYLLPFLKEHAADQFEYESAE